MFKLLPEHHTSSISSLHSSLFVHIASKWKRRARVCLGALGSDMNRAQWSEVESTRWLTLTSPNLLTHSSVASTLSSLRYTLPSLACMLHQVFERKTILGAHCHTRLCNTRTDLRFSSHQQFHPKEFMALTQRRRNILYAALPIYPLHWSFQLNHHISFFWLHSLHPLRRLENLGVLIL